MPSLPLIRKVYDAAEDDSSESSSSSEELPSDLEISKAAKKLASKVDLEDIFK